MMFWPHASDTEQVETHREVVFVFITTSPTGLLPANLLPQKALPNEISPKWMVFSLNIARRS